NYLLLNKLRTLSSRDLLTGVMNRNEMNNYVSSLCSANDQDKRSVGVVFADLNGLKAVNDIEGHAAGDLLLKNAANALREVFDESQIFRAGGDEFSIIVTDVTKEDLDRRIDEVRKACKKYVNLVFAMGGAVEADSRNVRMALRRADENMYEDKRLFYEQNPDRDGENRIGHSSDQSVDESFRIRSLVQETNYDHLTGLPRMSAFFKYAENWRKNMHEQGIPSAIVFINLNGMKYYNKKYGFAEGDVLIKCIATILVEVFGEENCSRFGQDHFSLFTEEADLEKRLDRVFTEARRVNSGRSLPVMAGIYLDSMGLVETSLACDRAKYACETNRDENESSYAYFDDKMLSRETNRQYIVENLDRALEENWVTAFYQPIIRATNRKVCDEEALARWIDPNRGMLSPADFIPILEETRLIYRVDLHIVDIILERIKEQKKRGIYVVPVSVNLSRTDFEACDIVAEIDNRVTAAGVDKELITIEITESVVGENPDYMLEQVSRFQKLGFKVWMDDFGSGYSSLDMLRDIPFDLIKFDMRFMRQLDSGPNARVLLTELMRMTQSLGIETVCEGVETAEQADFLTEIGCTKMQGFYFCKPVPVDEIRERIKNGMQIGFENPEETEYHRVVGSINMYNLSSVYADDMESSKHYFDTLPMVILEYDGENARLVRCNKSYRDFVDRFKELSDHTGPELMNAIERCHEDGQKVFLEERGNDGSTVHAMVKKIADNPIRDVAAYVGVVLEITPLPEEQITYSDVAQALSSDYVFLYYVNLETEQFMVYSPDKNGRGISVERHGENFFNESRKDVGELIYEDDRDGFLALFTRENILHTLDEQGVFVHTYRLMIDGVPTYVNMKIVRISTDDHHIIIGVNNVDSQMRQQEMLERLREEQITYARISTLMGDFIAIYSIDPDTGNYMEYSASNEYSELGAPKAGLDFFSDSRVNIEAAIHPDDLEYFMAVFSRDQILEKVKNGRVYKIQYRLLLGGETEKVSLRAGLVMEKDGPQLIVGVSRSSEE
ncbi:MAG: EAL domain-containing protein, partial [Eubacterium sp.]|nr:EAL domain-containing protein [Eubacterium sp.]